MFEIIRKGFVLKSNKPFKSCHASTIALLPDGSLFTAWFGGDEEGASNVDIWGSRCKNMTWSRPIRLAKDEEVPLWNPVLFYDDHNDKLWLFYKIGKHFSVWKTMYKTSIDFGNTWSADKELVKGDIGGRGPVRNKPIVLADGTWLAPASLEIDRWEAFVDISKDNGKTWVMSNIIPHISGDDLHSKEQESSLSVIPGKGIIQPTLWESATGHIHMFLRSTGGYIYRSDSTDYGKTWGPAYQTNLPNNNSGIDLTKLDNGWLVLVYNPVYGNWAARTPLILQVSKDNGKTWGEKLVLEENKGEYSYPAIISKGNDLYLTYTWNRENIAFWQIKVEV